jgi:uncharacterized SAM-binding protein YcdF (DUF218 family)
VRKSRAWIGALILGLAALVIFHVPILGALGSFLVRSDPPRKSDVIFVLAGDWGGSRVLKAGELVRHGYAPVAIVSGPKIYGIHECDIAIAMAERAGYPASYFVAFPHDATSTVEEVRDAIPLLRGRGVQHVLVVTSDFHTRRAGKIFHAQMPDIDFDMVAASDSHFSPHGWWHDREGEKTFAFEWMKTIAEWFGV